MLKKTIIVLLLVIVISCSISAKNFKGLKLDYNLKLRDLSYNEEVNLSYYRLKVDKYFSKKKEYFLDNVDLIPPHISYSKNIRGVYINGWTVGNKRKINKLINEVDNSNLNAIVIDLKDARGRVTFSKNLGIDSSGLIIKNLRQLIDKAHKRGIYVIGRLTVFKDPIFAKQIPEYALKYVLTNDKQTIINSENWTNPYSKEVWDYNLTIAQQAAKLGLDEIQFDYVRFPTLARDSKLTIKSKDGHSKVDAIVNFLKHAQNKLRDYGTLISADVFGLTTTVKGDLGIGQDIAKLIKYVDYISPMIYPSHYSSGIYGIENPDSNPYHVIVNSLEDARKKLGEHSYKLRPWLQDFSLGHNYTEKEIRDQIKAVKDNKLSSWLLWNPQSDYTIEAVIQKKKEERRKEGEQNGINRRKSYSRENES